MTTGQPCAFEACEQPGVSRVVVTAAEAAQWALRPGLLEAVDADLGSEGPRAAVGLMFCVEHASGVEREHFRARAAKLTTNESRVLRHLQSQAAVGGATTEATALRLNMGEPAVRTIMRRLTDAGVVQKSRQVGVNRGGKRATKYMAVTAEHEPPPVQPGLMEQP